MAPEGEFPAAPRVDDSGCEMDEVIHDAADAAALDALAQRRFGGGRDARVVAQGFLAGEAQAVVGQHPQEEDELIGGERAGGQSFQRTRPMTPR